MIATWRRYAERYEALSLRERALVFAAAVVLLLALGYTMRIEPELQKHRRAKTAIALKQAELKDFEAQVTKLFDGRAQDPQRAERERLAQLREALAETEARIVTQERRFTAPSQMRAVIQGLLGRASGVALVEMRTLATTTLSASKKPAAKPPANERLVYRHGLELTVAGSYLDLLAYVRDLERLPTQLYWGAIELDAAAYPRVTMKLTVYTLSLERAWLSV